MISDFEKVQRLGKMWLDGEMIAEISAETREARFASATVQMKGIVKAVEMLRKDERVAALDQALVEFYAFMHLRDESFFTHAKLLISDCKCNYSFTLTPSCPEYDYYRLYCLEHIACNLSALCIRDRLDDVESRWEDLSLPEEFPLTKNISANDLVSALPYWKKRFECCVLSYQAHLHGRAMNSLYWSFCDQCEVHPYCIPAMRPAAKIMAYLKAWLSLHPAYRTVLAYIPEEVKAMRIYRQFKYWKKVYSCDLPILHVKERGWEATKEIMLEPERIIELLAEFERRNPDLPWYNPDEDGGKGIHITIDGNDIAGPSYFRNDRNVKRVFSVQIPRPWGTQLSDQIYQWNMDGVNREFMPTIDDSLYVLSPVGPRKDIYEKFEAFIMEKAFHDQGCPDAECSPFECPKDHILDIEFLMCGTACQKNPMIPMSPKKRKREGDEEMVERAEDDEDAEIRPKKKMQKTN